MEHLEPPDANAANRKQDHIGLALRSQIKNTDDRFYYEPLLARHPHKELPSKILLGKTFKVPMWVSSMTGGTAMARTINHNLAKACGQYGMGMGLGSCRQLLYSDEYFKDFDVRHLIGEQPLYANLGIAQVETMLAKGEIDKIEALVRKLQADGLIVHINPLQEWLQPEGDHISRPPIETISELLLLSDLKVIVKEVGQGMGYESLKALLLLPIQALDFAASGGTNFAMLELLRSSDSHRQYFEPLAYVGHTAEQMVRMTNELVQEIGQEKVLCKQIIISGGVQNFLDGYYLMEKLCLPSVYGQAAAFLKHAQGQYSQLQEFIEAQISGLSVAMQFLRVR